MRIASDKCLTAAVSISTILRSPITESCFDLKRIVFIKITTTKSKINANRNLRNVFKGLFKNLFSITISFYCSMRCIKTQWMQREIAEDAEMLV